MELLKNEWESCAAESKEGKEVGATQAKDEQVIIFKDFMTSDRIPLTFIHS